MKNNLLERVPEIVEALRRDGYQDAADLIEQLAVPQPNEPPTLDAFERICAAVHDGWWDEKVRQGLVNHPDMMPYKELSESIKEYDRVTVRRVLDVLGVPYYRKPEGETK